MRIQSLFRGWLVTALAVSTGLVRAEEPKTRIDAVLSTPGFQSAHWGLLVVDGKTGEPVYQRNADQLFCPASVTKLFTTAAALTELGADHRFVTPVVRKGKVDADGTLSGDLILVAKGDLSLGGRTGPDGTLLFTDDDHSYAGGNLNAQLVPTDPLAGLDHLAREVHDSGIRAITGDVLVDDRLFEAARSSGSGPSRVSPIVINDNLVDVVVSPASKPGELATVRTVPETAFVTMDARVETVAEGESPTVSVRSVGPRRFSVRGRLPAGHPKAVKIYEVREPAAFARALFIEALQRRGVQVSASPLGENNADRLPDQTELAALTTVAEYTSPPFREYLKVILKVSQNLHASTLPLLIAAQHGETTAEAGLRREGALLKQLGVDVTTISFAGGAGGERADLVTPKATVALLRAMAQRPDFHAYEAALPVLGRDGTLTKHVSRESPVRGHARAKTGTYWVEDGLTGKSVMTGKGLAGYMETASGRPLVFAFFINNVPLNGSVSDGTTTAGRLLGSLCEIFYADEAAASKPASTPAPAIDARP
ncbi:MAG: D-alanyl-D-alanine carboxypeptidase/D-alanyl-D-alanine-endopeptidase [Isosphaeraceae bacterium]